MIPKLTIHDHGTPGKIDAFIHSMDAAMYLALGNTAVAVMQERTSAGKDVHGRDFVEYSTEPMCAPVTNRPPGYPVPAGGRLTKSGKSMHFPGGYREYKGGLGRGTTPQLSVSGQTLAAMQVTASDDKTVISFATAEAAEKAHGHHFGSNRLPRREHFGLGDIDSLEKLEDKLVELLVARAQRAGLPITGSA